MGRASTEPSISEDTFTGDEFADEDDQPTRHREPEAHGVDVLQLDHLATADTKDELGLDQTWAKSTLTPAELESRQVSFPPLRDVERSIREDIEMDAPASESHSDRTRRRIKGLIEQARRAHQQGDTIRAVIALELAFAEDPDSAVSHKLLNLHRTTVAAIFETYLADFQAAPALNVALTKLSYEHIDARAAFLLSRVDGAMTIENLLDVAGMPRIESLRYLCSMVLRGILILSR